jgi:acetyl esterase/lipase
MSRRRWFRITGILILLGALLFAGAAYRAPLRVFNELVPKDRGSVEVADGIAYGPDGRQRLDIYAPRGTARNARLPVIVFLYGGWWSSGFKSGYSFVGRALAARGFVVVMPDYRLVPHVTFPAFVQDSASAVKWTAAHAETYGGDPTRIVLAGHSAGAHIMALVALDPQWLGTTRKSVKAFIGLAGPYDFYPFEAEQTKAALGHWPRPMETQPISWASRDDPPVLLLNGAADDTVRSRNSVELARRLHAVGVPASVKLYPGIGHLGVVTSIALPLRWRAPILDDMADFVRKTTGSPR